MLELLVPARTPCMRSKRLNSAFPKAVLHLQCHIGRDTLCLVRSGDCHGTRFFQCRAERRAAFVGGTGEGRFPRPPGFDAWSVRSCLHHLGPCWPPDVKKWRRSLRVCWRRVGSLLRGHSSGLCRAGRICRTVRAHVRFSNASRPAAAVRKRDHVHRRPDDPVASIDTRVDTLALGSPRRTHRCRTCNHDVS